MFSTYGEAFNFLKKYVNILNQTNAKYIQDNYC